MRKSIDTRRVLLYRLLGFLKRGIIAAIFVSIFFVLTQDFQIFPGMMVGFFSKKLRHETPPGDVQELLATTSDGERLTVWRVETKSASPKVAVLLHGNGDSLSGFYQVQKWMASLGFTTYAFHYRGYGESTGFPSEQGIYRDGEAVVELAALREEIAVQDILIYGQSIGTGPAAYLAQHFHAKTLVLISPYTNLPAVVKELPLFGYLTPFLWYKFPTDSYLQNMRAACIIIAHGKRDGTISFQNSVSLVSANTAANNLTFIPSEEAGHNDILQYAAKEVGVAIQKCVSPSQR